MRADTRRGATLLTVAVLVAPTLPMVAGTTGVTVHQASAVLHWLRQRGLVRRLPMRPVQFALTATGVQAVRALYGPAPSILNVQALCTALGAPTKRPHRSPRAKRAVAVAA